MQDGIHTPTEMNNAGPQSRGPADAGHHLVLIERATVQDADAIKRMVVAAYSKYVERIGREPAPMTTDYHAVIAAGTQDVYVLRTRDRGAVPGPFSSPITQTITPSRSTTSSWIRQHRVMATAAS